ncbi:MAG: hypothetical protein ACJAT5_000939 [Lentimonas sp.]|jgi:hypothetical protein
MNNRDRIIVFAVGFVLGMLLVSFLLQRRAQKGTTVVDPWAEHNAAAIEAGAEPLPEGVPEVIRTGRIIDFGYLPSEADAQQKVWHLNFEKKYPFVRVTEDLQTGIFEYMAADQIKLELAEGVDVTKLKPMLDALNLRLRMFNRKERIAVIGVLNTDIDAVPKTIEAVQSCAELFSTVEPDFIEFKSQPSR